MSSESIDVRVGRLEDQLKEVINVQKGAFDLLEGLRKVTLELALMDTHLMEAVNGLKTELVSRMRLLAEAQIVDPSQREQLLETVSKAETDFDTSVFVINKTRERISKLLNPEPPPASKLPQTDRSKGIEGKKR